MENSIFDIIDQEDLPVTPPNTEVELGQGLCGEQCELIMPSLTLNPREPTLKDLQIMNQVISFSGTDISSTPSFSSTPKFSSDGKEEDKEDIMHDFKLEIRQLKYKLICTDMKKREIEEDNLNLHDDLQAQHYDINKLKKEVTSLKEENEYLNNQLNDSKQKHFGFIVTFLGIITTACTIMYKYNKNPI